MAQIQENVTLAPFTSFQIGGPARYFVAARSVADLQEALLFARSETVPFEILGGGTNLLISDSGFPGLVIKLEFCNVAVSGDEVTAEAGADLTQLVHSTAQWGLSGMETLAGIPGLVGGAVRGNAGAYGTSIGEVVANVTVLETDTLDLVTLPREECRFQYRSSLFKTDRRFVVIAPLLRLKQGDPDEIRQKIASTLAKRHARNLQCERSVGSFFMNPVVTDPELVRRFESDQQVRCRDSRIPAGWLIDQAGLRNTRVGSAMVSALHANYLINAGEASAREVMELAHLVKRKVQAVMGVELHEEVSMLGFSQDPTPP